MLHSPHGQILPPYSAGEYPPKKITPGAFYAGVAMKPRNICKSCGKEDVLSKQCEECAQEYAFRLLGFSDGWIQTKKAFEIIEKELPNNKKIC
jgi:hypothetical protein